MICISWRRNICPLLLLLLLVVVLHQLSAFPRVSWWPGKSYIHPVVVSHPVSSLPSKNPSLFTLLRNQILVPCVILRYYWTGEVANCLSSFIFTPLFFSPSRDSRLWHTARDRHLVQVGHCITQPFLTSRRILSVSVRGYKRVY